MTETLLAVAGLVTVGAATPGPNNLAVFRSAARGGIAAALPTMAGILAGGLVLVMVCWGGAGMLLDRLPGLRRVLTLAGCAYLAWLGVRLLGNSFRTLRDDGRAELPAGVTGVFLFQFLNPKAWVMVLTAVSFSGAGWLDALRLAAVFTVIPACFLILWSALGAVLNRALQWPDCRRWFDRAVGTLLVACAAWLTSAV